MIDLKPYAKTLAHKKVGVFGLGLSGLASVKALIHAGIEVIAWDDREDQRKKAIQFGACEGDLSNILDSSFDFLLLSPGVPLTHPEPHAVVKKAYSENIEIIGDIELLHRSGHGLKTIGITGTNGKSTTTALMAHVLNSCGLKAIAAGNIGKPVLELGLDNIDILVLEMSSYQLDLCAEFHPDISMLLNITPDHLDRHGTIEHYRDVKAKIFEGQGLGIIGVDDAYTKHILDNSIVHKEREMKTVSVKEKANIYVEDGVLYSADKKIGALLEFDTLKGVHNHQNCACVYVAASALGLDDADILSAMQSYAGLPHRQYKVGSIGAVTFINDSKATNAESTSKALSSYNDIFWILGGQAKEGGLSGLEIYKDKIRKAYLIGEAAEEFMPWFQELKIAAEICNTLDKATKHAYIDATEKNKEATILLAPACASWDQFRSFEDRGDHFMKAFEKIKREMA